MCYHKEHDFNSQCTRNHFSLGVCLDPLEELTVLSRVPSLQRGHSGQERDTKGKEEKEKRKRKGREEEGQTGPFLHHMRIRKFRVRVKVGLELRLGLGWLGCKNGLHPRKDVKGKVSRGGKVLLSLHFSTSNTGWFVVICCNIGALIAVTCDF